MSTARHARTAAAAAAAAARLCTARRRRGTPSRPGLDPRCRGRCCWRCWAWRPVAQGWSFAWGEDADLIAAIRAPRTLGALLAGALLGLSGALAQGLFRNPLADPYLLGSAAGAGLGVVLVLAAGGLLGASLGLAASSLLLRLGLVGAAFAGALAGVALTLVLARGAGGRWCCCWPAWWWACC